VWQIYNQAAMDSCYRPRQQDFQLPPTRLITAFGNPAVLGYFERSFRGFQSFGGFGFIGVASHLSIVVG